MGKYYYPQGGLPPQTHLTTERAIVTEAYTVIPKGVMTDIVTSTLPGFSNTRSWILACQMPTGRGSWPTFSCRC